MPTPLSAHPPSKSAPASGLERGSEVAASWLLNGLCWALQRMKEQHAERLATALDVFMPLWVRRQRRANIETLCDPLNWTVRQKRDLYRRHMEYLGRMRVHLARLRSLTPDQIRSSVVVRGEEHLQAALAKRRGLLVVSGHTGTWWHVPICLASRGYEVSLVANLRLFPGAGNYMRSIAQRFDLRLAQAGEGAYEMAREVFRRNKVFYLAFDQTVRPERSVRMRFCEASSLIDPGPAILTLRQRVPALWASSYHDDKGRSCIAFAPETEFGSGTPFSTPEAVLRYWLDMLQGDVEPHPEQWWTLSFNALARASALSSSSAERAPTI